MLIRAEGWQLLDRYPKERLKYEEYISRITMDKVELARLRTDALDIEILKLVSELKICTSKQIIRFLLQNNKAKLKTCSNRLKKLFELGCIDRFFPMTPSGKGTEPVHVVLNLIGAKIIKHDGRFRRTILLNKSWRHTATVNEYLSLMYKDYDSYKIEDPLIWDETKIVPDIKFFKDDKEIFVEVDMGTESIILLKDKISKYCDYQRWANEDIEVIFVLRYEDTKEKLDRFINQLIKKNIFKTKLFSDFKD